MQPDARVLGAIPAPGWIDRLARIVLMRYVLASAIALAADTAIFLALLEAGVPAVVASAIGYLLGIVVHWVVSSRAVFNGAVVADGPGRTHQKILFTLAAFVGLSLTMGVVALSTRSGIDPRLAKLAAVAASFTVTWSLRRWVVFARKID